MRRDEVRGEMLRQHGAIEQRVHQVEVAARPISFGDRTNLGPLRVRCEQLRERVVRHLDWEDRHLHRILLAGGEPGQALARELERDHGEQLRVLDEILAICSRDRLPAIVAGRVLEWTRELRNEMQREENAVEDAGVFAGAGAHAGLAPG